MNAVTFSLFSMTVTHMTGTLTRLDFSLFALDREPFIYYIFILVCYVFGSMLLSVFESWVKQQFKMILIAMAVYILSVSFFATNEVIVLSSLAVLMGFQNALPIKMQQSLMRTTHFTGTLTDIGYTVGKVLKKQQQISFKFTAQCATILFFIFGGICAIVAKALALPLLPLASVFYVILSCVLWMKGLGFDFE